MSDEKPMVIYCGADDTRIETYHRGEDDTALVECPTCGQQDTVKKVLSDVATNYVLLGLGKKIKPRWLMKDEG